MMIVQIKTLLLKIYNRSLLIVCRKVGALPQSAIPYYSPVPKEMDNDRDIYFSRFFRLFKTNNKLKA
jgi:hypothetical protein